MTASRREFVAGMAATAALASSGAADAESDLHAKLDQWQKETDLVKPSDYVAYLKDGDAHGFASLEKLERGFASALEEIRSCKVGSVPAIWHIYNMGYVVKTRDALFSIDLNHRRDLELASMLDFALITHNHNDHYREPFYRAMNGAGKTVVNNFRDNYGAADWRKGGKCWWEAGGYTRAEKTFRIKDVEVRTSLTDHNQYLVDFTTTFEIKVGDWKLFHSGDCGNSKKLKTVHGSPDIWLVFPGCGLDVADAYRRIRPRKMVFGHLWELGHSTGRLTTPMVKTALARVKAEGGRVVVPMWGERVV